MRTTILAAAVAVASLLGACGRDEAPSRDPFVAIEQEFERTRDDVMAAPRWERVQVLRGSGAGERTVAIAPDAIQWRLRLRCDSTADVVARSGDEPARARCGSRPAEFIGTGRRPLAFAGTGAWRAVVEQQVETPTAEPPLPGAARPLLAGRFRDIERGTRGSALVHRSRGRLVLRLEGFATAATADLFVWISARRAPSTTRDALRSPHREIAALKATRGDQNYVLPRRIRPRDVRSIVIWCEPLRIAYASADLRRQR